jgi:hypothetical protein
MNDDRFNSHANYPMLAQTTDSDIHAREARSQAAAGSDPQPVFAHAHIPSPSLTRGWPARPESHTIPVENATPLLNDWNEALRAAAVSKEGKHWLSRGVGGAVQLVARARTRRPYRYGTSHVPVLQLGQRSTRLAYW